ncbi:MAG TPA: Crp/Fnr family transcriptional regulator [Saprospiraceae bacterium]|nr:Crp/Fnr family transcriptional regulator [Saprospiraceae bacterium]HMU03285.1 Crp/Fnr family transcriptional regulator [Saprospiraceae bacterium]
MSKGPSPHCQNCSTCPQYDVSMFNNLDDQFLGQLDGIKKILHVKKGNLVFKEGAIPKGLFCIRSGKVKLVQMGADGKDQIVQMLKSGDVLGHRAIFGNDVNSSSAEALEDTKICFFPRNLFYELVEQNGRLILKFANLLACELKEAEHKITTTAQQSVLVRISESLILLIEKYGIHNTSHALNIQISRADIANMAGTTRESATRSLSKLKSLGIIELSRKNILILDEKRLLAMTMG